jgi:hypothetical protein
LADTGEGKDIAPAADKPEGILIFCGGFNSLAQKRFSMAC